MSVHQGKKIVQALEAFNANRIVQSNPGSLLSAALKGGGIQKRHIERLQKTLEEEVRQLPAHLGVVRAPKNHGVDRIFYGHMTVGQDLDGKVLYDLYTPHMVSYEMVPKKYIRNEVDLPVSFHAQRTAFRFIKHTSQVLDYRSDEFFTSLMFGSVMMQALTHGTDGGPPENPVPMFIPHAEGLFLGYADPMPPDTYRRQYDSVTSRGKRLLIEHNIASEAGQPYVPATRMIAKTFVPFYDMNTEKLTVWEKLRDIVESPDQRAGIQNSFNGFVVENMKLTPDQDQGVKNVFAAVHDVMQTREWAWLARSSLDRGHTPKTSYAERRAVYERTNIAAKPTFG